jgi:hypothetical protein
MKDAPEVKKKQLSVNYSAPLNELSGDTGTKCQVIEDDGVYTLKTSAPRGIHTSSFIRRPLNRKPSLRVTDPEDLPGIDCPFVSENDVALLKHSPPPRSPSPEPTSMRSNQSSRPPSRQNSPLSSKSSSFSFDVVDMGDGPMSNQNSGIASGRGSQPVTPSNLLRNRPNQKFPRLSNGALPPLSNHSSRSTSPLPMNISPAHSTHSSSENIPLDPHGAGTAEGGLSDILLEATYLMKGLKILIIEDSTFQRKLMTKKLHSTGRRPSGVAALDRKGSFDQTDVSVSPSMSNGLKETTGGVFNFSEIILTTTPSPAVVTTDLLQCNSSNSATTSNEFSLVTDAIGEFPSASQSPADIGQQKDQSPASILTSNQSNEISLTPKNISNHSPKENAEDGWHVSEAVNGEEAIQRLITTKETFDIIFVDENLQSSGGNLLGHEVSSPSLLSFSSLPLLSSPLLSSPLLFVASLTALSFASVPPVGGKNSPWSSLSSILNNYYWL